MKYITVDCGCTNMRARLFEDGRLLHIVRKKAGGRNTALTGSNKFITDALRECLSTLCAEAGVHNSEIEIVLLSGTITSNVGVYHAHHRPAPAGPRECAQGAEYVTLKDVCGIPMLFIPGVKTLPSDTGLCGVELIDSYDSMSGEECETFGLAKLTGLGGNFAITLPGSYTKAFFVDGEGRIATMDTGMCGEFMTALAENTLIGLTLPHPVIQKIIPEKLIEGYIYAHARGVSSALAKSRILQVNCGYTLDESGNFFAGAALHDDIEASCRVVVPGRPLVIGGSNPYREVFRILIEHRGCEASEIITVTDEQNEMCSPTGQLEVYREYLKLKAAK